MTKLRIVALVVMINFLSSTLAPTLLYALTSGPTAPEYTSFEPVDASDMVNLNTGDFTYTIPLLEVPGPEGGYPLALSYHAGISPEEEASWVGLGWSMNAGSLNRMVNGFPDDINRSTNLIHDTWNGGQTTTNSVSVGVGLGEFLGIDVGVTVANDTYKGIGIGTNIGVGVNINKNLSIGVQFGSTPYGGDYVGLGVSLGTSGSAAGASAYAGLLLSSDGTGNSQLSVVGGVGVGVRYGEGLRNNQSLLGASISANDKGTTSSISVLGVSGSTMNSKANNLDILSSGWAMTIPVWYGIYVGIGQSSTRYYLDQLDETPVYGSLYGANILTSDFANVSYDCYALATPDATFQSNPDASLGGSLPAYDNYTVLGQGIGGSIQPYIYEQGSLFRKGSVAFEYGYNPFTQKVGFRFANDFSNSFIRGGLDAAYSSANDYKTNITSSIGQSNSSYNSSSISDFDKTSGMLAGSKHVEWFTNQQINAYTVNPGTHDLHGFIPSIDQRPSYLQVNSEYGLDAPDNIGGFMVTNESGVSYHYSIPVYNFNNHTEYNNTIEGNYQRSITQSTPYAYTWLLTAVTGPDYVDNVPLGVVDENDWGYWVKMEYGKWTDKYIWRTPTDGTTKDIESATSVFSTGRKELYYLDAIKTRSHTALFVKDIRRDAKSVGSQDDGGFDVHKNADNTVQSLPISTMKLNRVLLFSNRILTKQLAQINNVNGTTAPGISSVNELKAHGTLLKHFYLNSANEQVIFHNGQGVLDEDDINDAQTKLSNYALRQYKLNYSGTYDLCQGLPNSFDMVYTTGTNQYAKSAQLSGKLTLSSIETLGTNSTKIIPATSFDYALKATPYNKNATDVWGMYKSDYTPDNTDGRDADYDRQRTTQVASLQSAPNKKAWSLSTISTPIGADINIEYESDFYNNNVLMTKKNIAVKSMVPTGITNQYILSLFSSELLSNIPELTAGTSVAFRMLFAHSFIPPGSFDGFTSKPFTYSISNDNGLEVNTQIVSIQNTNNQIVINDPSGLIYTWTHTQYQQAGLNPSLYLVFANGNIIFDAIPTQTLAGGDLRVKSIGLKSDYVENITSYTYLNGTTSYEPIDYKMYVDQSTVTSGFFGLSSDELNRYKNGVYQQYAEIISNNSFIPPSGVLYKNVIVQDKVRHYEKSNSPTYYTEIPGQGSTQYDFTVFDRTMMPRYEGQLNTLEDNTKQKTVTFKDYRNRVGLFLGATQYSQQDAIGSSISQSTNNYLHLTSTDYANDLSTTYANQGRLDQAFFEKKNVDGTENLLITKIEAYPIIPTGNTVSDYKKDITQESKILTFDYYSGMPTQSWMKDAFGNEFITEMVPARIPYPNMGHKINNPQNKHMLTQQAATYTYKVTPKISSPKTLTDYNQVGLIAANAQTWGTGLSVHTSDNINGVGIAPQSLNIWRTVSSNSWIGNDSKDLNVDGTHDISDFTRFDFNNMANNNSYWQKDNEYTMIDAYSHILETKDLNGNYGSVLMDPTYQYILASASNARETEIAYSGCEFNESYIYNQGNNSAKNVYEGRVALGQGTVIKDSLRSHTGKYSLLVGSSQEGFTYSFTPEAGRKYRSSVWLYLPGTAEGSGDDQATNARLVYRVKGTNTILNNVNEGFRTTARKASSSYLLNVEINADLIPKKADGSIPDVEVVCVSINADRSIYFDDFRFAPIEAGFSSYVYDLDRGLLTSILDNNNFYTRFQYDEMGKLVRTYQEIFAVTEKKVSERHYNYGKK